MKKNKDNLASVFVEMLHKEMEELVDEMSKCTTDIEVTCKITFNDVPTYVARSRETRASLETLKKQMKDSVADMPYAKTSVRIKMKDKYNEPEDPMNDRKIDADWLINLVKEDLEKAKGDK